MSQSAQRCSSSERGVAAVEFALVSVVFFSMVIAVVEFARLMFVYANVIEATRLGARMAAVCGVADSAKVKARMKMQLSILEAGNIDIRYPVSGCAALTCDPLTVRVQNLSVTLGIPLAPITFAVPAFTTALPTESLSGTLNPVCS